MNIDNTFIAIDFETATGYRNSVCEVGICVVVGGEIRETRSWFVRPPDNYYWYKFIQIHGITPDDTEDAPNFDQVWEEIERLYLDDFDLFVAHNAAFDRSCLHTAAAYYHVHLPELRWACSCTTARKLYRLPSHSLGYLCQYFNIPEGTHHRAGDDAEMCARLYLRELHDLTPNR